MWQRIFAKPLLSKSLLPPIYFSSFPKLYWAISPTASSLCIKAELSGKESRILKNIKLSVLYTEGHTMGRIFL